MPWHRTVLLPALAGLAVSLAIAVGQQPSQPAPPAPADKKPPPAAPGEKPGPPGRPAEAPPRADPEAGPFLQRAVWMLAPQQLCWTGVQPEFIGLLGGSVSAPWPANLPWQAMGFGSAKGALHPWVETTLWEQGDLQGGNFTAQGRYLIGPEHRLRLDLNVRLGDRKGRVQVVSDGKALWRATSAGAGKFPSVAKQDLIKLLQAMDRDKLPASTREEFFRNQSFDGVAPLLRTLRRSMTFTKKENARWNGRDVVVLTGFWTNEATGGSIPRDRWPGSLPRQCRLFLDAQAPHWPHRIEWWGPAAPQQPDQLLMQIEYRDPRMLRTMPPERLAREFSFDPGSAEVMDITERLLQMIQNRAQEMKQQPDGNLPPEPPRMP